MSYRIVSIGDLAAELVMPVRLPIQAGAYQEIAWHSVEPGGAGNFLIAGQRLGAQMAALGAVGDDLYGRHILDVLRAEGVQVEGVVVTPNTATAFVAVLFEPDTGNFCYVWHGSHGEAIQVSAVAARLIDEADALFMQGFTLYEKTLRPLVDQAIASGKPIWFDVGPIAKDLDEADRVRIRKSAQVILTTEDELPSIAGGRTGQPAYDFVLDAGPRMLVIKRGSAGCRVVTRQNQADQPDQIDIPAFSIQARDVIGAGDCFNAAFMYGILKGLSPSDAALLANAAGAAKIQKLGTGRSMPTRAEITAVLRAGGYTLNF
jgi:sugar/nucleoside kinase (ribokinase family)